MSNKVFRLKYGEYQARLFELGMTQKELSDKIGISPQHVSDVVVGKKPNVSARIAFAIAEGLGMTPGDLFELVPAEKVVRPKGAAVAAQPLPA